jgi:hypothetical protein
VPSAGHELLPLLIGGYSAANRKADFSGFYTAVLWSGSFVVSAALFRAFGTDLAEVPFLTTRPQAQVPGPLAFASLSRYNNVTRHIQ